MLELAKEHVKQLNIEFPEIFLKPFNKESILFLLNNFKIKLNVIKDSPILCNIENTEKGYTINLNSSKITKSYELYLALSHEIGHWYLENNYAEFSSLTLKQIEYYARKFAIELLFPRSLREDAMRKLISAENVMEILRFSNKLNIPAASILNILYEDYLSKNVIIEKFNVIWIEIRWSTNRKTHDLPKFRITNALYHPQYCFIPTNKGFAGIFNDINILSNLISGKEVSIQEKMILYINTGSKPIYKKTTLTFTLSIVKPKEYRNENISRYLILAKPIFK